MSDISHVYGCEFPGCREIGTETRRWKPGFGYVPAVYCPEHASTEAGGE